MASGGARGQVPTIDAVCYNDKFYPLKTFDIRWAASGDQALVAAVTGKQIVLLALLLHLEESAAGSETYILKSATTAIEVQWVFGPGEGVVLPLGAIGPYLAITVAGAALNVNLANGYGTHFKGSYIEV